MTTNTPTVPSVSEECAHESTDALAEHGTWHEWCQDCEETLRTDELFLCEDCGTYTVLNDECLNGEHPTE